MTNTIIKDRLIHAATEYDRKQSTKRGYNPFALGQYFAAIDETMSEVEKGISVQAALANHFNDRLLTALVKVVAHTDECSDANDRSSREVCIC